MKLLYGKKLTEECLELFYIDTFVLTVTQKVFSQVILFIDVLKFMHERTGFLIASNWIRSFVTCNGGIAIWLNGPFGFYI